MVVSSQKRAVKVRKVLEYPRIKTALLGATCICAGLAFAAAAQAERSLTIDLVGAEFTDNIDYDRENEAGTNLQFGAEYRHSFAVGAFSEVEFSGGFDGYYNTNDPSDSGSDSFFAAGFLNSFDVFDASVTFEIGNALRDTLSFDAERYVTVGADLSNDLEIGENGSLSSYLGASRDWDIQSDAAVSFLSVGADYAHDIGAVTSVSLGGDLTVDAADMRNDYMTTFTASVDRSLSDTASLSLSLSQESYHAPDYADGYTRMSLSPALTLDYDF